MFLKIFSTPNEAKNFARLKEGKIFIQYNWDWIKRKTIKEYIVKW